MTTVEQVVFWGAVLVMAGGAAGCCLTVHGMRRDLDDFLDWHDGYVKTLEARMEAAGVPGLVSYIAAPPMPELLPERPEPEAPPVRLETRPIPVVRATTTVMPVPAADRPTAAQQAAPTRPDFEKMPTPAEARTAEEYGRHAKPPAYQP